METGFLNRLKAVQNSLWHSINASRRSIWTLTEKGRAIAFPDFQSDELLTIALTEPCPLKEMGLSKSKQNCLKRKYRTLAFLGDTLIDAILADYLDRTGQEYEQEDLLLSVTRIKRSPTKSKPKTKSVSV